MSYFKPRIDETGIHVPDYVSIRDYLISEFQRIFGQDLYLGADSQDYQMISLFSTAVDDVNALVVESYNNRNPDYARGNALDLILPLNGLIRMPATHSTVELTLTGSDGAYIAAGSIAVDRAGFRWVTQANVTIDATGVAKVAARAESSGNIKAEAGSINEIGTPTSGWISVVNESSALAGRDTESDAAVRQRRLASVENMSTAVIPAMYGALQEVPGVDRVRVYENSTETVDANGITAHSICVVIENGVDLEIANVIYKKKAPGCGLYGTTTVNVTGFFDDVVPISFSRPVDRHIQVAITIRQYPGYSIDLEVAIINSVVDYISGIGIGQTLETGLLWGVVLANNPSAILFAPTSILTGNAGGSLAADSIIPAYNEVFLCEFSDVTITYV